MEKFQVGDKVTLKLGSTIMEVVEIIGDQIKCVWVSKYGNPQQNKFLFSMLKKATPIPPSAYGIMEHT